MRKTLVAGLAICLFVYTVGAAAQVTVPAASTFQLSGGTLNLGDADLLVGGDLTLGSGSVSDAANVSILAGGVFDAGSGNIALFGDWSNLGSFTAGSSAVNFIDGPLAQSALTGTTTFNAASFISLTGKSYLFPVGIAQTFTTSLTILGTAATGIQFRSAAPGQVAYLNLLAAGAQNIDYVGVSNVHAVGQILAPTKTNDGGTGDALGWFNTVAAAVATAVAPALTWIGMLLLGLIFAGLASHHLRFTNRVIQ